MIETNLDRPGVVIAATAMSVAAVLVFALLPVISGVMAEHFSLSEEEIGLVAASYFGAYALISATASLWVRRVSWRLIRWLGFGLMVLGIGLCLISTSFVMACVGLAVTAIGAGALYPVCMTIVSDMTHMDRVFALKLSAEQLVPAAVLLVLTAFLASAMSLSQVFSVLLLVVVLTFFASVWLPDQGSGKHDHPASTADTPVKAYLALAALALNFAGYAGLWAFLERLGNAEGFDSAFVNTWLSVGLITAGIGPLGAAWLADRIGRLVPVFIATLLSILTLLMLTEGLSTTAYAMVLTFLPLTYCFAIAYLLSIVGDVDHNGRVAGLMPFALAIGAAAGPAIFGVVLASNGPVVSVMGVFIAAGAGLMAFIQWRHQSELTEVAAA